MCQLYLYLGSSARDIMYSMYLYVMQKLPRLSYLDGFPVGAGLPELYVLKDGVHVVGVHDVLGLALHSARGGAVELLLVTPATHLSLLLVLRIRIRNLVPFWPLEPGWVKNQDPVPG
jgi:hypothetical protein